MQMEDNSESIVSNFEIDFILIQNLKLLYIQKEAISLLEISLIRMA